MSFLPSLASTKVAALKERKSVATTSLLLPLHNIHRGGGPSRTGTRTRSSATTKSSVTSDTAADDADAVKRRRRWRPRRPTVTARSVMCYLLCGSRVVQQSMRNTLVNVLIYMARDMELSTTTKGTMITAIATGYLFTQVPGGMLADTFGPKNVMTVSLLLSAVCTILVPTAGEYYGLSGMWWCMALMGAVQGPMFPTCSVFLSRWMPAVSEPGMKDEKAWGTSMLDMGISVGSLLIIPFTTSLAESVGWQQTFRVVGFASLGFVAVWMVLAASTPGECWFISPEELQYLEEHVAKPPPVSAAVSVSPKSTTSKGKGRNNNRQTGKEKGEPSSSSSSSSDVGWYGLPWRMATHPGLWAIFICHIAFNFGAYYLTNWSPTYYKDVLGLEPLEAKYHLMLPHLTNLLIRVINPLLVSKVAAKGYPLIWSRKFFTIMGYLLSAGCLAPVYALRFQNPWLSTLLFSIANGFFGIAPLGFKSNYLDVTNQFVGIVAGYGNTLGTVASVIGPKLTAWQLERSGQNWYVVLGTVVGVNMIVSLNYAIHAVTTPIEQMILIPVVDNKDKKEKGAAKKK